MEENAIHLLAQLVDRRDSDTLLLGVSDILPLQPPRVPCHIRDEPLTLLHLRLLSGSPELRQSLRLRLMRRQSRRGLLLYRHSLRLRLLSQRARCGRCRRRRPLRRRPRLRHPHLRRRHGLLGQSLGIRLLRRETFRLGSLRRQPDRIVTFRLGLLRKDQFRLRLHCRQQLRLRLLNLGAGPHSFVVAEPNTHSPRTVLALDGGHVLLYIAE